jgi:cytochrome c oxidase subunit 2
MGSAVLFALVVVGTLLSLVVPFVTKSWWLPPVATQHGVGYDQHFMLSMVMCGLILTPAQLALAWVVVRFRDRGGNATYSHGNNKMEFLWTSLALVFFIAMNVLGQRMWAELRFQPAPAGAAEIEVTGQQFTWNIRYPGADGKFGRTDPHLISDSSGNPLGLDPEDPPGKDDVVLPTMTLAVNKPVELIIRSKDVTHNFFVPEFRIKQDAVPGLAVKIHFTPTRIGKYEVACSELCGLGHYKMRTFVYVKPQEDYDKWWKEQSKK